MLDSQIDPEDYNEELEGLSKEEIDELIRQAETERKEYYI